VIGWLASPRTLGVLLAVSLAVNLFLGGVVAGRTTGEAVQAKRNFDAILAPLPDAKRALVRKEFRAALVDVRKDHQAAQAVRAQLAAEIAKPAPDPATLDRQFAELQRRTTAMQGAMQQAFKRAAMQLTQEERQAVIDSLTRRARPQPIPEI
jgi:uncharacterized membrane protein